MGRLTKALLRARLVLVLLVGIWGCDSHAHEKTTKSYTLKPGESKKITFKTDRKSRVSFVVELTSQERSMCKKQCVRMYYQNKIGEGEVVTSTTNGTLDISPDEGKVSFTIQNLEAFPIKTLVSWRSF